MQGLYNNIAWHVFVVKSLRLLIFQEPQNVPPAEQAAARCQTTLCETLQACVQEVGACRR